MSFDKLRATAQSLGLDGLVKSKSQIELEMREAQLAIASGSGAAHAALNAQLNQAMNQAMYHGNDAAAGLASPMAQQGWAAANQPAAGPLFELIRNPFQAASLYVRLRMTREELKQKDIEIAFVRQMGGCVHVAIVNQNQIVTMIDEDVGAFPSDAFIARIRLLL